MESPMSSLGKTIHILRLARGYSTTTLATRAEVSPSLVSLIESGKKEPSIAVLNQIAEALSVSVELLIIMAQPRDSKLKTTDAKSNKIAASIENIILSEERLKKALQDNG
jgi:XRE family transcriptional regulator, regulator of sulfur utilization